jgi:hypothetical protein
VYLDRAEHRLAERFSEAVEAARAGVIFAHEPKAYQRWANERRRALAAAGGGGLTGEELEAAVLTLLSTSPDIVAVRYSRAVH